MKAGRAMAVLVTGAGVIGCQVARVLVERGERVVLYDLRPVPEHIASIVELSRVTVVQGDITDGERLAKTASAHGIDRIVHTAACLTGPARNDPPMAAAVNVVGSAMVMELARRAGVKRVVLSGSTTVYYPIFKDFCGERIPEDFGMRVASEHPGSFYSATKLAMEAFAHLYVEQHGLDVVVVRYGAVLGAWSGPNAGTISAMVQAYLGAAAQGRPAVIDNPAHVWAGVEEFVDARDCAAGTVAALDAKTLRQRIYHISCDRAYTLEEFVASVRRVYPALKVDIRAKTGGGIAGLPYARRAPSDISAARRDLGYAPRYSLDDSLRYFARLVTH